MYDIALTVAACLRAGTRVDVAVNRLCVDAVQSFRLTGVNVRQVGVNEEVSLTLGPLNVLSEGL